MERGDTFRVLKMTDPDPDPEATRVSELLALEEGGRATPEQREELALYRVESGDARRLVRRALADHDPARRDRAWLSRVAGDRRIEKRENSGRVRWQRGAGLFLLAFGLIAPGLSPVVAPVAVLAGVGILLWSTLAQRLWDLSDDEYREIKK